MTGADRREVEALWALHVHDTPRRQVALEGARRLLFDLIPRHSRDRREFPMEIIHVLPLFSANRYRVNHQGETVARWIEPHAHVRSRSGQRSMAPLPRPQHAPKTSLTAQKTACR